VSGRTEVTMLKALLFKEGHEGTEMSVGFPSQEESAMSVGGAPRC
jgi:hypothetical protein